MPYLVISILILVISFIVIFFAKAIIGIEYVRSGNKDIISISVFALAGLINIKLDIPLSIFGDQKSKLRFPKKSEFGKRITNTQDEDKEFNVKDLYDKAVKIYKLITSHKSFIGEVRKYMSGRVRLRRFELEIEFGAGDAYYTAIIIGIIWSIYGLIEYYLSNNNEMLNNENHHNRVQVNPNFNKKSLMIDLYCIFNVKVANIIIISLKILKHYLKSKYKTKTMIGADAYG
jgi:ribosomal protein L23